MENENLNIRGLERSEQAVECRAEQLVSRGSGVISFFFLSFFF